MQLANYLIAAAVVHQSCSSAANLSRWYCSKLPFRLFFLHSWNTYYCCISTILKPMAAWNKMHLASQKICILVLWKEASTLSTLHGIANCIKNGTTRKIVFQPMLVNSVSAVSPITAFGQVWESCSKHF